MLCKDCGNDVGHFDYTRADSTRICRCCYALLSGSERAHCSLRVHDSLGRAEYERMQRYTVTTLPVSLHAIYGSQLYFLVWLFSSHLHLPRHVIESILWKRVTVDRDEARNSITVLLDSQLICAYDWDVYNITQSGRRGTEYTSLSRSIEWNASGSIVSYQEFDNDAPNTPNGIHIEPMAWICEYYHGRLQMERFFRNGAYYEFKWTSFLSV